MENVLYNLGGRMVALSDRLQIVSTNLANASTPGFKRVVGGFAGTFDNALASGLAGTAT